MITIQIVKDNNRRNHTLTIIAVLLVAFVAGSLRNYYEETGHYATSDKFNSFQTQNFLASEGTAVFKRGVGGNKRASDAESCETALKAKVISMDVSITTKKGLNQEITQSKERCQFRDNCAWMKNLAREFNAEKKCGLS